MTRERLPFPKEIELPADEGTFARSALVTCLTDDDCRLAEIPDTAQGKAVLDFLSGTGYEMDRIDEWQVNIAGHGHQKPSEPPDAIDCAGSADLAHLFAAFLAGWGLYGAIRCSNPHQSMKGLAESVRQLGGEILGRGEGYAPPWCVRPSPLSIGEVRPANPHPSLRSALAILFLLGQGTGSFPADTPGHDGMERAIGHYRGEIRGSEGRLFIKGGERVMAKRRDMPLSFRLGVVVMVAVALTSSKPVRLPRICLNPTRARTLEYLGRSGISFDVEKMSDLDSEIAGDIIINPSEPTGMELGKGAVRSAYEDLGSLLVLACLSDGLSEFDLGHLTEPEAQGAIKLASEIAEVVNAPYDTSGNRITIEGNPSAADANIDAIENVTDYPTRAILSLAFNTPRPLDKDHCIQEFGKSLTQVILGDLLF